MKDMNKCKDGKPHKLKEVRKKDERFLSGYEVFEKCENCSRQRYSMAMNIGALLRQVKSTLDWMNIPEEERKLTPQLLADVSHLQFPYVTQELMDYDKNDNPIYKLKGNWCRFFKKKLTIKQAKQLLDNPDKCI